jgi:hypothetical protein
MRQSAVKVTLQRACEILLAGQVGAVADPDRERRRPELPSYVDARDIMCHRLRTDAGVGRRQAAVAVAVGLPRLVLERIGIYRVEPEPQRRRFFPQGTVILYLIPRKMRRHARRDAAQLLHDRTIRELLADAGGLAGDRKLGETGSPAAGSPARQRNGKTRDRARDRLDVGIAALQRAGERGIILSDRPHLGGVGCLDLVLREWKLGHCRARLAQRGNACALPASTLMIFPVDFAETSLAKNITASAISSGSTLVLSIDRLR